VPGGEPIRSRARVLDAKAEVGTTRVSFRFIDPDAETVERLERFVFDALLDQIQDAPAAGPKRK
jgi:c-di-GMP-binding flagellar brake protein YcgR